MAGIMDYAATEVATFREKPLCEVDSRVFSQLAMVRMAGLVPLHQKDGRWAVRMRRAVQRFSGAEVRGSRFTDLLRAERYHDMFTGLVPEKVKESVLGNIPERRFGQPSEVASLVAILASDDAAYITGQAIESD